ncbi:MAG TPA: LssY C-terminal domain-containing protein [Bryobacteraceae bacterium]|nr:LssY C-terminal domain-containing protein [Bryobacteraceae bacterium]
MRWSLLLLCLPALAQTANQLAKELDVAASAQWVDTGLDLRAGDSVQFTTTGTVNFVGRSAGPQGAQRGFLDLIKGYPVNEAGPGALIGRVGSSDAAVPFLIGAGRQIQVSRAGRLFLSVNKTSSDNPDGSFHVKVEFASRGPEATAAPASYKLAEVTTAMIDRIPRRVTDAQGNAGDNTNFVVVGSEERVLQTFDAAGWVKVDREKKDAVLHTIISTFTKQAYVELPMSELTLFGRVQDYGLAHAVPIQVVAQRHHLRLWKAPFQVEGQELWVGAATHDIGFDRDNRNNGVTHKIDPNVDDEREFVGRSLEETGLVAKLSYVIPSQASKEARTATGATFHSDGRVMVVHLIPVSATQASGTPDVKFANLFCSVREKENPDTGDWPACEQFLQTAPQTRVDLTPLATKYRVLIVPGFFSACASSIAPAFGDGLEHMRNQHKMTVEVWVPPNDSSEANGTAIARYLRDHMVTDQRKYVVLGYSKGAPDVQTALALHPEAKDAVAAFVSVAGAVGGSLIADLLPAQANGWIQRFKLGKCEGDVATAFTSLKKSVRQQFLAAHPNPVVPSYSLPAVSDRAHTSKALLEAWQLMSFLSQRQDSQLAYEDAILPGSTVLGAARADHLAVAMPFEKASDSSIRSFADQGHYPRAALLEAMLRFVIGDLEAAQ